jgi:hypothetical protein
MALLAGLTVTLCAVVVAGQKSTKTIPNPPASPQAKTSQPATHFTQGTITSIEANRMVLTRKIRGKTEQTAFVMDSQTQRSGNLAAGAHVSIQYREAGNQKIAAAVRELSTSAVVKTGAKPR